MNTERQTYLALAIFAALILLVFFGVIPLPFKFGPDYGPRIMRATIEKNIGTVRSCINAGDNVNEPRKSDGETALHVAVETDVAIAKLLLEHGANPNIQDDIGQTPLHIVVLRRHDDIIPLLMKYHADPNIKDKFGETPLSDARKSGDARAVRMMSGY